MPPQKQSKFLTLALRFTKWVGSPASLITHTIVFAACFLGVFFGISFDKVMLILTTAVSLEAIYLAIFIQLTVNNQAQSIQEVAEDIDEIQEDVDEIQEDIDEIQEDVDEIQEDVDEIQEDVEDATSVTFDTVTLNTVYTDLKKLMDDIEKLKQQKIDHDKIQSQ